MGLWVSILDGGVGLWVWIFDGVWDCGCGFLMGCGTVGVSIVEEF